MKDAIDPSSPADASGRRPSPHRSFAVGRRCPEGADEGRQHSHLRSARPLTLKRQVDKRFQVRASFGPIASLGDHACEGLQFDCSSVR